MKQSWGAGMTNDKKQNTLRNVNLGLNKDKVSLQFEVILNLSTTVAFTSIRMFLTIKALCLFLIIVFQRSSIILNLYFYSISLLNLLRLPREYRWTTFCRRTLFHGRLLYFVRLWTDVPPWSQSPARNATLSLPRTPTSFSRKRWVCGLLTPYFHTRPIINATEPLALHLCWNLSVNHYNSSTIQHYCIIQHYATYCRNTLHHWTLTGTSVDRYRIPENAVILYIALVGASWDSCS